MTTSPGLASQRTPHAAFDLDRRAPGDPQIVRRNRQDGRYDVGLDARVAEKVDRGRLAFAQHGQLGDPGRIAAGQESERGKQHVNPYGQQNARHDREETHRVSSGRERLHGTGKMAYSSVDKQAPRTMALPATADRGPNPTKSTLDDGRSAARQRDD
jgi:hypothetical protein